MRKPRRAPLRAHKAAATHNTRKWGNFAGEGACSRAYLKDIIRHLVLDLAAQGFYYE